MQVKVGVGVRYRLGFIILKKKKGDMYVNMQPEIGLGVRLRLGWDRDRYIV